MIGWSEVVFWSLVSVVTSWVPLTVVLLILGIAQDDDRLFVTGFIMLVIAFLTGVVGGLIVHYASEGEDAQH